MPNPKSETTTNEIEKCPVCDNTLVARLHSPIKNLECLICPPTFAEAAEPTPTHRAAWELTNAIGDYINAGGTGAYIFDALMKFAEVVKNDAGI